MTTQIIHGTLREVREKLNAVTDEEQAAHLVLYKETPPATGKADINTDAYGKPFPTKEETLAYLRERLQNAITDPEENARAEAELAELHENLNRNRVEAGERPLFPE